MRILVLTFYYTPDLCAGSFRATALIESLRKKISPSDELEIITTMPNRYSSLTNEALEYEEDENIKINRIPLGLHKNGFLDQSLLFLKFAFHALRLLRTRKNYDIVYATSSRLMTAFLGAFIAHKQKSKLFLDIRDIFIDTLESVFKKRKLRYIIPLLRVIEKYTIRSASHINLVSKGFKEYFFTLNDKIPYTFYSNGIDNVFLDYDFHKEVATTKKIITYAGNIGEGQGLEKIIPQMAKALGNGYQINIYGDGGSKTKLIQCLKGIDNVALYNPINRDTLLAIYKESDFLFLHLNDYEAFEKVLPSKLFEYAATGKFIIAGVGGYAQKFIAENIEGSLIFEPCNCEDFLTKFTESDHGTTSNRAAFIQKFSRENIMDELSIKVHGL
jgi:glycosyltransferase involved in cell wall biosynthesis